MGRAATFLVSLPERVVRALAAAVGGAVHETAEVVLPRFARRSRLYEATAKNMLRIAIELVGDVEREAPAGQPAPSELLKRKTAGNVVELGSIAAFGFSPLWLLAAASDISRGSRVYLESLVTELKRAGVLSEETELKTVDDLLSALEGTSGTTARLVDLPPLELAELRKSFAELRASAAELPTPQELAALYEGLQRTAARERRSLLEVSSGMGLAFMLSARHLGREHLVTPYREDWQPLREEGFAAYSRRISEPYRTAIEDHFDPARSTWTERALDRLRR
jgi:DNA-directed RNA polymerase subunit F